MSLHESNFFSVIATENCIVIGGGTFYIKEQDLILQYMAFKQEYKEYQ